MDIGVTASLASRAPRMSMAFIFTRTSGSDIELDQDLIDFGILEIAEFLEFGTAHVGVGVLEAELYVFDDFERRFRGSRYSHVVDAGLHVALMRHRIGTERAAQSLAAILRETRGAEWPARRQSRRQQINFA